MKIGRKKNGFTLVELIVVLVILAILAALLIPALVGYIDKAKQKSVIAETRSILTAVQTEASELYAAKFDEQKALQSTGFVIASKSGEKFNEEKTVFTNNDRKNCFDSILKLSEVSSLNKKGKFISIVDTSGKVYTVIYDNGEGQIGLYFAESGEYIALKYNGQDPCEKIYASYINKVVVLNMNKGADGWGEFFKKEYVIPNLKDGGAEE